ncbi:glycosyltransferase family 2 protein [Spirillospora sp. NPDC047279]|uniref:glycosyltransferase family 2 protein n=1 Tax=Spirillospora sp. NPDC047279 TaxID=3155478 RepID=UPI0033C72719
MGPLLLLGFVEHRLKVTVIVPVYNCVASLGRALESVFEQSLGMDAIEIVAVDDGSTDGSGELLDRMAAERPGMTVVHQENSGGPGAPRNVGLERASGEYVFFLDADDWLGPEALERMCGVADANGTDVVFGKYVGVNRGVPTAIFAKNIASTTLERTPGLYGTLAVMKLFRAEPLRRHGVRFGEGVLSGEDVIFSAHAFLHAGSFSVVGDYDCYYWVDREDGSSVMQNGGAPAVEYFPRMAELFDVVDRHVEPGALYDRLIARHIEWDVLFHRFHRFYLTQDEGDQRANEEAARDLLKRWLTPSVAELLPVHARLIAHCVGTGLRTELREIIEFQYGGGRAAPTVVDGRMFARYPRFRDPVSAIPDSCYEISDQRLNVQRRFSEIAWRDGALEISGRAELVGIDEPQEVTLLLRAKGAGDEVRVPAVVSDQGFRAEIRFEEEALGEGVWEVHVEVRVRDFAVLRRLLAAEADTAVPERRLVVSGSVVQAAVEPSWLTLTLRVTGKAAALLEVDEVGWGGRGRLRLRGGLAAALPAGCPIEASAEVVHRGDGPVRHGSAEGTFTGDRLEVSAEFDLRDCAAGTWDTWLEITVDGARFRVRPPVSELPDGAPSGLLRRAAPYATDRGALSVKITDSPARRRGRRLADRLQRRS